MRRRLRIIFSKRNGSVVLFVGISIFGLYYLPNVVDWSAFKALKTPTLGLIVVIALLYMPLSTFSTWLLLRGMGYFAPFQRLLLVTTASLSTNYITPVKVGIPVRLWLYKSALKIPLHSGSASIVIETSLNWMIAVIMSFVGVQFILDQSDVHYFITSLAIFIALTTVFVLFCPQFFNFLAKQLIPIKYYNRLSEWGSHFLRSIKDLPLKVLIGMIFLYSLRVFLRAFCLHLALKDAGAFLTLFELAIAQSISGIIGIISLLPMGIGAKDLGLALLLSQVGVPRAAALFGVVIDRVLWTVIPLIAGFISANILGVTMLMKDNNELDDT